MAFNAFGGTLVALEIPAPGITSASQAKSTEATLHERRQSCNQAALSLPAYEQLTTVANPHAHMRAVTDTDFYP